MEVYFALFMNHYIVGGDLGGTNLRTVIANQEKILLKVNQNVLKEGDEATIPNQFYNQISYGLQHLGISPDEVLGVGLSTCSPFLDGKIVSPNLCGGLGGKAPNDWKSIPMTDVLESKLKEGGYQSGFKMGNDCVTSVVVERLFGAGQGVDDLLYVTWSTGIGTGAYCTFIDAETGKERVGLLAGKNRNAPHGGHIGPGFPAHTLSLNYQTPNCGCGQRGDLESIAQGDAITGMARWELHNNDTQFTSILWNYCGRQLDKLETKDIFKAAKAEDALATRVVNRVIEHFANGLITYINMLDTQVIVIGGSVMKNRDYIMPRLKEHIDQKSFKALSQGVEIRLAELGDYVGVIAGLSLVMPSRWTQQWSESKPWEQEIKEINLDTEK